MKSRSLHSSIEFFGGSKRWSRNDSDIEPGEVLDRADLLEDLLEAGAGRGRESPEALAASTRSFQASLPSSQSKLSVCSARRLGTSSGSRIFAKETGGPGACGYRVVGFADVAVREAAKRGPSEGSLAVRARMP